MWPFSFIFLYCFREVVRCLVVLYCQLTLHAGSPGRRIGMVMRMPTSRMPVSVDWFSFCVRVIVVGKVSQSTMFPTGKV